MEASLYWNRGELLEPGVICRRFSVAATGHMGLEPRDGSLRILKDFLWMVLDHFTSMRRPRGQKLYLLWPDDIGGKKA